MTTLGFANVDSRGRVSLKKYLIPEVRIVKVRTFEEGPFINGLIVVPAVME